MRNRGFTLIELLIAIALSASIVLVATVSFRVASQTVTVCNRLSVENRMMQAGFLRACDEADFWTGWDDPDDAARQPLRAYRGSAGALVGPTPFTSATASGAFDAQGKDPTCAGGLPFTPFTVSFPSAGPAANPENLTGWNGEDPGLWSDPRTWWQGDYPQKFNTDLKCGYYAIFSNLAANAQIGSIGYGTVAAPHHWLANQMWGLHDALGWYGFLDYMPPNTIFSCSGSYNPSTNEDGVPNLLVGSLTRFTFDDNKTDWARGRCQVVGGSCYPQTYLVESPWDPASGAARSTASLVTDHQVWYMTGSSGYADFRGWGDYDYSYLRQQSEQMLQDSGMEVDLAPQRPAHWPQARVTVHRILKDRFYTLARVHVVSPLTGEAVELPFTIFGTTLRGARLQRRHPANGSGWARWDDTPNATNDRTLDSP